MVATSRPAELAIEAHRLIKHCGSNCAFDGVGHAVRLRLQQLSRQSG